MDIKLKKMSRRYEHAWFILLIGWFLAIAYYVYGSDKPILIFISIIFMLISFLLVDMLRKNWWD